MESYTFRSIFKRTWESWNEHNTSQMAAALAFYGALSLAPLLIVLVTMLGAFVDDALVRQEIYRYILLATNSNIADLAYSLMTSPLSPSTGYLVASSSILLTLLAAARVFVQLRNSLATICHIETKSGNLIKDTLISRTAAFLIVFLIGFVLLGSVLVSVWLSVAKAALEKRGSGGLIIFQLTEPILTFLTLTAVIAVIFKTFTQTPTGWKRSIPGAIGTSFLLVAGKILISFYLRYAGLSNAYGAAGSLMALLIWIYYSAQILLLGAEFTRAYTRG